MADKTPDMMAVFKSVGNTFYNGVLIALGTTASRYASTKFLKLKDRPIDMKLKNVGMLALDIGVGKMLKDKAQQNGLPTEIFK